MPCKGGYLMNQPARTRLHRTQTPPSPRKPDNEITVDIMIPVLNEAHVLRKSVETVLKFCKANLKYRWQVVVVDNGSTDGTQAVAEGLAAEYAQVRFMHLSQRGRGRALRNSWLQSKADIVSYMDV